MDQPQNLQVDEISGNYFRTGFGWGLFISIMYIVCFLLLTIILLANGDNITNTYSRLMPSQQMNLPVSALIKVLIIAFLVLIFIFSFFLMASLQIKKGIERHDQATFNSGLRYFKNGLMIYGVIAILGIAFSLVSLFR